MTEMAVLNGVAIEELLMAGTGALAPYLIAAALYLLPQIKTVYVTNPHHPEYSAAACEAITPQVEKLLGDTHGFAVSGYDLLFRGVCPECGGKTSL